MVNKHHTMLNMWLVWMWGQHQVILPILKQEHVLKRESAKHLKVGCMLAVTMVPCSSTLLVYGNPAALQNLMTPPVLHTSQWNEPITELFKVTALWALWMKLAGLWFRSSTVDVVEAAILKQLLRYMPGLGSLLELVTCRFDTTWTVNLVADHLT